MVSKADLVNAVALNSASLIGTLGGIGEIAQHGSVRRMSLALQRHQRKRDIGCSDLAAVVKGNAWAQLETEYQPVGGDGQILRRQEVDRVRLVERPRHQRCKS